MFQLRLLFSHIKQEKWILKMVNNMMMTKKMEIIFLMNNNYYLQILELIHRILTKTKQNKETMTHNKILNNT